MMSTTSSEIWPGGRGEETMSLSLPSPCVIWSAVTAASLTNAGWPTCPLCGRCPSAEAVVHSSENYSEGPHMGDPGWLNCLHPTTACPHQSATLLGEGHNTQPSQGEEPTRNLHLTFTIISRILCYLPLTIPYFSSLGVRGGGCGGC